MSLAPLAAQAQSAPSFSKAFAPTQIGPGAFSTLTFTISNPGAGTVTDLAFTDTLPAGMTLAESPASTTCPDAVLVAPPGGGTIGFSNARLAGSQSCTVTVDVTTSAVATYTNVSGDLTSSAGNSGSASADLTVATSQPGFGKSFSPASISLGGTSALTFIIDNTLNTAPIGRLDFTDALPGGLRVADPANASTTCVSADAPNTTLTAVPGAGTISLAAVGFNVSGFQVLPAGESCTVSVDVVGTMVGTQVNSVTLLADSVARGKAIAALTVAGAPVGSVQITKDFVDDPAIAGGSTTLDFTLTNLDRDNDATDVAFDDVLTDMLAGFSASSAVPASAPCGAGSALALGGTISLTGGSIPAGGTCRFSVVVEVPPGAVGSYPNQTSAVTGTINGTPVTGNQASNTLTVLAAAPLIFAKEYVPGSVLAGDDVIIRYTITNPNADVGADATAITFADELTDTSGASPVPAFDTGFLPFFVPAVPPGAGAACGGTASLVFPASDRRAVQLTGGTLAPGATCSFDVTVTIPATLPGGTYSDRSDVLRATVLGTSLTTAPASDSLTVSGGVNLLFTKAFSGPAVPGGTVDLTFFIENAPESNPVTDLAFADDLDATLNGLTAGAPSMNTCGGTMTGTTALSYSGGSLAAGATCEITVPVTAPVTAASGTYVNVTSALTATGSGLSLSFPPATADLTVAGLRFDKAFLTDPVIAGATTTLRYTIENLHPTDDATITLFSDNLNAALSGLAATGAPGVNTCGGTLSGTTDLFYSGGGVLSGQSCTIEVDVAVPGAASDGFYNSASGSLFANQGGAVVIAPAVATLTVQSAQLLLTKSFVDDPAAPGGTATLEFTLTNLNASGAASDIAFTDDLDAMLSGATMASADGPACGGTVSGSGSGLIGFAGGVALPAGSSCSFQVAVAIPGGAAAGTYTNTTSSVSGTISSLPVTGSAASDSLVISTVGAQFSKAFTGPSAAGATATLRFTLTNPNAGTITGLAFTDDLDAMLSGAVATGLPTDPCGAGSSIVGTSLLTFSGGELAGSGDSCTFDVEVTLPATAAAGTYPNTTSNLTASGVFSAGPATASLQVEPPPSFTKSFSPSTIAVGQEATLNFTIDNSASLLDADDIAFTDHLPAGLEIAELPNRQLGCFPASTLVHLSGTPGDTVVTSGGGGVAAGATCTLSIQVVATAAGTLVNTTGDLTSTTGNSGTASDTLTVEPVPVFTQIAYSSDLFVGQEGYLYYIIDNLGSSVDATAAAFTNDFPTGIEVGPTATSLMSCTGVGTIPAIPVSAGDTSISYSGATIPAGEECQLYIRIIGTTAGTFTNTSGDLTSSLGNSGPSSSTYVIHPLPSFTKAFDSPIIGAGQTTAVTFTIDNTGSGLHVTGLDFTDTLPAGIEVATAPNASTTCTGGTLTATAGGGVISYSGGFVPANAACSVSVDVTGNSISTHVNTTGDLTFASGTLNAGPASATLTVVPQPGFAKVFAPDVIGVNAAPGTLTFTIDNAASVVAATALDFTDNLPAGIAVAPTPNAATTCTGGTLTATAGASVVSYTGGTGAASAECTVQIDVVGVSFGEHVNTSGDLTSSLGNSGTASASVTVMPADLDISEVGFGPIADGGTLPLGDQPAATGPLPTTLTLANSGPSALTLTGFATANATNVTLDFVAPLPTQIASAGSEPLGITLTPLAVGPFSVDISILSNDPDESPYVVTLSGTGLDVTAPAGYSVAFDQDPVNIASQTAASFTFLGAEPDTTYDFEITSSGGGTPVTGTGTIVTPTDQITAPDLTGLADGTLTLTVTLTDPAGNTGAEAMDTAAKDATVPGVTIDTPIASDDVINAGEAPTVTLSGTTTDLAEGATVSLTVTDGAAGSVTLTPGVTGGLWSVVADLTALADGPLSLTADATDAAGNAAPQQTALVVKDATAPAGYTAALDRDPVNGTNAAAVGVTFDGAEPGATYAFAITSGNGGTPVIGSGTIATPTDQVTGLDLTGLADGILTLTVTLTDPAGNTGAEATGTAAKDTVVPTASLAGPLTAQSGAFTVDLTFSEAVFGLDLSLVDIDNGSASGLTGGGAVYSFIVTPDHDGPIGITLLAGAAADAAGNLTAEAGPLSAIAHLTGVPNPVPLPDADEDGIPDILESDFGDRDGDGIPDRSDFDPQGYFYCEDDGRIIPGGSFSVSGPLGTNSGLGIANGINITRDGSTGEIQWFALVPGTFTMSLTYPAAVGLPSTARLPSGTLDLTALLPANPAFLGSSEAGASGFLADAALAANPAFHTSFTIEPGDPFVLSNNIPMTQCAENAVTLTAATDGAEANGGAPTDVTFTVTQDRLSTQDTVIGLALGGSATAGDDFTTPAATLTIPAGAITATLTVPVLEDDAIEGPETLEVTLTGIVSGDLTTRLGATLGATATILDDDFADIAVTNVDLVTSEGGDDDARMTFVLLGAPIAPVTLTFAGDSQCSVSPATMTFTAADFGTPQALTIRARDDDKVEGTHSCQPGVSVASADARFDALQLTLAAVTVTDDLVDQIREPLTRILEEDLKNTVQTQGRNFSRMAKGALSRLQDGRELPCGTLSAFDVDGSIEIKDATGAADGTFGRDTYNCATDTREILDGSFTLNKTEDTGLQALLQVAVQREKFVSDSEIAGYFFGGYLSRTDVSGPGDGDITGLGVNGGLYGARGLSDGLFLDYYLAGAAGNHRFDIDFDAAPAQINARGSYGYLAGFAGVGLSGQQAFDRFIMKPRVALDLAHAFAGDADVTARQSGLTHTGVIKLDDFSGMRATAEVTFESLAAPGGSEALSARMRAAITPRLTCTLNSVDSDTECGMGLALAWERTDTVSGLTFGIELDVEQIDDDRSLTFDIRRERPIWDGAGAVVTRLSMPQARTWHVEHVVQVDF